MGPTSACTGSPTTKLLVEDNLSLFFIFRLDEVDKSLKIATIRML